MLCFLFKNCWSWLYNIIVYQNQKGKRYKWNSNPYLFSILTESYTKKSSPNTYWHKELCSCSLDNVKQWTIHWTPICLFIRVVFAWVIVWLIFVPFDQDAPALYSEVCLNRMHKIFPLITLPWLWQCPYYHSKHVWLCTKLNKWRQYLNIEIVYYMYVEYFV